MLRSLLRVLPLLPLLGASAFAAPRSAPEKDRGAETVQARQHVTLGDSATELTGPWKFHPGDNAAWSATEMDDSGWGTIDLTPPPGSANVSLGTSGFIPGWTEQGYPGYSGYAWYRLRINVEGARTRLALKMPGRFDDAYQVYVNGQRIGEFGSFKDSGVTAYSALPRGFPLPADLRGGPMTIAVRMWMDSATQFASPDAGGMHEPPVLGLAPVIGTQVRLDWDDSVHNVGIGYLEGLILLLALAVSLTHFWMEPSDKAYLWLALVSLATSISNAVVLLVNFTTWIPQTAGVILNNVIMTPLRISLWVLFWAYWFRVGPAAWLQRTVWSLALLLALGTAALRPPLYGQVIPVHAASTLVPWLMGVKLALAALLIWVTYKGIRKQRGEAWLALPAVVLAVMANYQQELRLIHIRTAFSFFDFRVSLGTASTMLSLLLVTAMLSRRFLLSQRRQVRWGWEVEQAREVQRVLIPARLPEISGLAIEGEYRPAREVGGAFFQIIPSETDGSVLMVVGDVTGKGLCAGMLVALIVGVIHTAAETNPDPESVLKTLNDRLCERANGSATCLALRITRDGEVTLTNGGHLPPYLNGVEMEMEGALPLGTIPEMDYAVKHFRMAEGDTLMLMSDGVAEAQDEHGVLFGFDRIHDLLRKPITAAELATAAQEFGQEDDILVLRVERKAARSSVFHAEQTLAAI